MESMRPWIVAAVLLVLLALAFGVPVAFGEPPSECFCQVGDAIAST